MSFTLIHLSLLASPNFIVNLVTFLMIVAIKLTYLGIISMSIFMFRTLLFVAGHYVRYIDHRTLEQKLHFISVISMNNSGTNLFLNNRRNYLKLT
jgi:hypothetical protein